MAVSRRRRWVDALLIPLACAAALAPAGIARADEYLDRVNAAFKGVAPETRSDEVLLPLLAKMDRPPAILKTQVRAALLAAEGPGWNECSEWARKPAQQALLDALAKVTTEDDRLKAHVFAQPYGEGASLEMIAAEMYTELGDPPLLAAARHFYMPALENLGVLAHVEASRRAGDGDAAGALRVLIDWTFFTRQMADRRFLKEKRWAVQSMRLALERIRDVVYRDLLSDKHTLDPISLRDAAGRLRDRGGFLALDRISLPQGEFIAREQLLARIMVENSGPDESTFGSTLARVASTDRPLQLFGAAAYWDTVRADHANTRDTRAALDGVQTDFNKRWALPPFDRVLGTFSDYRKNIAPSARFSALQLGLGDVEELFDERQRLLTELAGTRMTLGVYGYFLRQKSFPLALAAIRPDFVRDIDRDPYSRNNQDIQFFVPVRDTPKGPNGEELPVTIQMHPPSPYPQFQIDLGANRFVLYSVGPDGDRGWAAFATQERTGVPGDYLLFPPTLSLYRQRLLETNQLN